MNAEAKAILEAALMCAQQPLVSKEMLALLGPEASREGLAVVLAELQAEWQARGSLQLVETASGWRFQTHGAVRAALAGLHPEKPRRYSRAAMETLAVIAYRQPVTRGDIEDIRGVVVSSDIVKQLEDRGWIEVIGHRDAPGRPQLYATTKPFLDDLGLRSLSDLPPLDDMGSAPMARILAETDGPLQASLLDLADAPEFELNVEPPDATLMPTVDGPAEAVEGVHLPMQLSPPELSVATEANDASDASPDTQPDEAPKP
jgi:segregation and condensation protein B